MQYYHTKLQIGPEMALAKSSVDLNENFEFLVVGVVSPVVDLLK